MTVLSGSATVHMNAAPDVVWDLVTDVARIGEFSPETLDGRWIDGANGPALGARFQGHVKRNGRPPMYWTTCTIVECEPPWLFAFTVGAPGIKGHNRWTYRMEPSGGGVNVTESFEMTGSMFVNIYAKLIGKARTRTNVRNMQATLERMKAVAEAGERGE